MMRKLSIAFLLIGVFGSVPSVFQTFSHVDDSTYEFTNLEPDEESSPTRMATHARYHAFREFLLAVAVLGVILWTFIRPDRAGRSEKWWIALTLSVAYTMGWWLPWPFYGLRAPHAVAETVHAVSTIGLLAGVLLARPSGRQPAD